MCVWSWDASALHRGVKADVAFSLDDHNIPWETAHRTWPVEVLQPPINPVSRGYFLVRTLIKMAGCGFSKKYVDIESKSNIPVSANQIYENPAAGLRPGPAELPARQRGEVCVVCTGPAMYRHCRHALSVSGHTHTLCLLCLDNCTLSLLLLQQHCLIFVCSAEGTSLLTVSLASASTHVALLLDCTSPFVRFFSYCAWWFSAANSYIYIYALSTKWYPFGT